MYTVYIYCFPTLLCIWIEPAICSVAPLSAIGSRLFLQSTQKHFFTSSLSPGAKACILASKGKALPYKSWWGAGNREVKGQQRGSLIKREREGGMWKGGGMFD